MVILDTKSPKWEDFLLKFRFYHSKKLLGKNVLEVSSGCLFRKDVLSIPCGLLSSHLTDSETSYSHRPESSPPGPGSLPGSGIRGRRRRGWQSWVGGGLSGWQTLGGIIHLMDMSWANSGRWWRTGKPGVLQSMGLQRVRHDRVTEHLMVQFRLFPWLCPVEVVLSILLVPRAIFFPGFWISLFNVHLFFFVSLKKLKC